MPTKLIIDVDPGIGDALAVSLAVCDPALDLVGITATAGRVSGRDASRNAQAIVEWLDPPKWPRLGRCDDPARDTPIEIGAELVTAEMINGPSGLGGYDPEIADLHSPRESAKLLVDLVRDDPNEITLLTLGPLTNVQRALELAPDFLSHLNSLVCLAGTLSGGDVTAAAEFNAYADPEAARHVLRSPATKTLVPVDSAAATLTFDVFDRVLTDNESRLGRLLAGMLPFAFRAHHDHLGREGIPLPELATLLAIVEPRFAERESMLVDVETAGELTRGMTVFDRRGVPHWRTNIDVITAVDSQAVLDYFGRIVRAATA